MPGVMAHHDDINKPTVWTVALLLTALLALAWLNP